MSPVPSSRSSVAVFAASAAALAAFAALPSPSRAEEVYFDTISTAKATRLHGAYFGAFGGGSGFNDASFGKRLGGLGLDASDDSGWLAGVEFGYSYATPFPIRPAIEVELFYLDNDLPADGNGGASYKGHLRAGTLMLNGILALDLEDYRAEVGDFWAGFKPYIGAGLGGAYTTVRNQNLSIPGGGGGKLGSGSNWSYAYNFFAGIEYAFDDMWSIYGEYRKLFFDRLANGSIKDSEFDLWTLGFKVQY